MLTTDASESTSLSTANVSTPPNAEVSVGVSHKRKVQHVLSNTKRFKIVTWMKRYVEENSEKGICAAAVREFPQYFRG